MVFGILLIAMQDKFIGILMSIAGACLIVLGAVDLFQRCVSTAVIKIVSGILIIICGWVLVEAVLYVISALLLIFGILLLYDKIRKRYVCDSLLKAVILYAIPSVMILIGVLLLFHQALAMRFIFIVCGLLTLVEGGMFLIDAFEEE